MGRTVLACNIEIARSVSLSGFPCNHLGEVQMNGILELQHRKDSMPSGEEEEKLGRRDRGTIINLSNAFIFSEATK